jgi:hypothetical protein
MKTTLINLRGMIANIALGNPDHNRQIATIDRLIDKFGPLRIVDTKEALPVLYRSTS